MSAQGYCIMKPTGEIVKRTETYFEALEEVRDTDLLIVFSHEAVGDLNARLAVAEAQAVRSAELKE